MKYSFLALMASFLALLMMAFVPPDLPFVDQSATPTEKVFRFPTAPPAEPSNISIIVITRPGYQIVRKSPTDSTIMYRVHYGERFLCTANNGDGWYGIRLPDGKEGFISSAGDHTQLRVVPSNELTMSFLRASLTVTANTTLTLYLQPNTAFELKRPVDYSPWMAAYCFYKGDELPVCGKATSEGREWYLIRGGGIDDEGELMWVLASGCKTKIGTPKSITTIPLSWYD